MGGGALVYARTDNIKACVNLLKAVHFRDVCYFFIKRL